MVIASAAETLGSLEEQSVPSSLRAVRRFTPAKRARLGAAALAAALETDEDFRGHVAHRYRSLHPELAACLDEGRTPPAAPAADVAAGAYLLRGPRWQELVEQAAGRQEPQETADPAVPARIAGLEAALSTARAAVERHAGELKSERRKAQEAAETARRRLREATERSRRTERSVSEQLTTVSAQLERVQAQYAVAQEDLKRLRRKVSELTVALEAARRGHREARAVDDVRLRVLLDTLQAAAGGLRRELALPPAVERPADALAGQLAGTVADPLVGIGGRGELPDDPSLIDQLLAVPGIHLIVDGYNVTKSGYGSLTLEDQRARLLTGLAALFSRTTAEVTCVFDGTEASARPTGLVMPRGVRVLFSPMGLTADQVIVQLTREEPPGRPVGVVTSDREIIEAVRRAGARAVPSRALLARLDRS